MRGRILTKASPSSSFPNVNPNRESPMPKQQSRSHRWSDAANRAEAALQDLLDIQQEYEEWKDNLPENLQQSALGEKLEAVCDLDLQGAQDTISEAIDIELPMGFGRD